MFAALPLALCSPRAAFAQKTPYQFQVKSTTHTAAKNFPTVGVARVLALRVEFEEDDNPLTTGTGKFEMTGGSTGDFDAPPRNAAYFQSQLLALSNYYRKVSREQLVIQADVFPKDGAAPYKVSRQMNYYVPVGDEKLLDSRLAEFSQESITLANAGGEIDFSQYDSFIIFHAGVGGDFAFDFDDTPQDMPSVYLGADFFQKELGGGDPEYKGIPVNDGSAFVSQCILLPETQYQDGLSIGLLGTMAIMFGNQLGLPILFNPDNGRAGVGVFGLMDQGSGNFSGLLPAQPNAWEKVFLGWETPVEIRSPGEYRVAISQTANPDKIYKIPINANEYFLLENRNRDLFGDGVAIGRDLNGERIEFYWDEQGQSVRFDTTKVRMLSVITEVNEYDFGLPGSGILIWHIDEAVINAKIADNRVNADLENRGIDLEEADGAQDIGRYYDFFSAAGGSENGVFEDMFWASNKINLLVNSSKQVSFTPFTMPASHSNSLANTSIYIDSFSEADTVMTFRFNNKKLQDGFPRKVTMAAQNRFNAPLAFDLDNDGLQEIIATSTDGRIFIWSFDGSPFMGSGASAGLVATSEGRAFSPVSFSTGGKPYIVVATDRGATILSPLDDDSDGQLDLFTEFALQGKSFVAQCMVEIQNEAGFKVALGSNEGDIIVLQYSAQDGQLSWSSLSVSGSVSGFAMFDESHWVYTTAAGDIGMLAPNEDGILWSENFSGGFPFAPVVTELNNDNQLDIVAVSDAPEFVSLNRSGVLADGFPVRIPLKPNSQLAVGNIDDDFSPEFVFVSQNGQLAAFNHLGYYADEFPIGLASSALDSGFDRQNSSLVIADLTGDQIANFVVNTSKNSVSAYSSTGDKLTGFPYSTGNAFDSSPYLTDLDSDGDIEIIVADSDGFLYVYDLAAKFDETTFAWPGLLGDATHSSVFMPAQNEENPEIEAVMAKGSVYNYPNPTEGNKTTIRFQLTENANMKIRFFDLAGAFVDELRASRSGPGESEIEWSLNNIQSGVYMARVEAKSAARTSVEIIKIAVVK